MLPIARLPSGDGIPLGCGRAATIWEKSF